MRTEDLSPAAVAYVVARMRPADRAEIMAQRWRDCDAALARDVMTWGARCGWVLCADDGEPIACLGALEMWPGVWSVWMFATNKFRQIRLSSTKHVKRTMIPALRAAGAHRAEARSAAGHHEAHRWLKALGARQEAVLTGYGKHGEDFAVFTWWR